MTKKQGNALKPGIYKVHWKRGGWSWAAIGEVFSEHGRTPCFDRDIMAVNWGGSLPASRMWRKIAKVERAPLTKMRGER